MTQEEKQILLADLSARLPYGVKVLVDIEKEPEVLYSIDTFRPRVSFSTTAYHCVYIENIKPYLRPMSSITKKERLEISDFTSFVYKDYHQEETYSVVYQHMIDKYIDYLNSHFLDWRGLIPMCLAIEATEDMYKSK